MIAVRTKPAKTARSLILCIGLIAGYLSITGRKAFFKNLADNVIPRRQRKNLTV